MSKNRNKPKPKQPKAGVSPGSQRQPVAGAKPRQRKHPIPGATLEIDKNACLVFGMRLVDDGGPFGWAGLPAKEIRQIREACRSWESMKLGELFGASGNKPIPAENFDPPAKKRWREIGLDDYDGLWELRVSGKGRLWGMLKDNIFYIVWWDPDHLVCPAPKKHT